MSLVFSVVVLFSFQLKCFAHDSDAVAFSTSPAAQEEFLAPSTLGSGDCLPEDWPVESQIVAARPDSPLTKLHPQPDFRGCYPRVLIGEETFGLHKKFNSTGVNQQDVCAYLPMSDIGQSKRSHAYWLCSAWDEGPGFEALIPGECVNRNYQIKKNALKAIPESELHPDPAFAGCYPRINIGGVTLGLLTKLASPDQCEYRDLSQYSNDKMPSMVCPPWK